VDNCNKNPECKTLQPFAYQDKFQAPANRNDLPITAVKWNKLGHRLLALGSREVDAVVLDPESGYSPTQISVGRISILA
jgi:hypothetical protein